jgi:uracil-DNA glycosylase family 4
MRSSATVADPRKRWFQLQSDLGGDEVIFDAPVSELNTAPRPAEAGGATPPPDAATPARSAPRYAPGAEPAWLVGAPPIPGPGIAVRSPQADLGVASLEETLAAIATAVAGCSRCPLCEGRTQTVPGEGDPSAGLMVIGEGPGEQEDLSGRPFVGRAGALLDKMLESIEAPRPTVFIANVVKCRPPRNRAPLPDERAACLPYLHRQIALIRPKVLLALGATAAEAMLGVKKPLGSLRLQVHSYDGIPLVVTYHPAALLRNPNWKRPAWDDVRIARQLLDLGE